MEPQSSSSWPTASRYFQSEEAVAGSPCANWLHRLVRIKALGCLCFSPCIQTGSKAPTAQERASGHYRCSWHGMSLYLCCHNTIKSRLSLPVHDPQMLVVRIPASTESCVPICWGQPAPRPTQALLERTRPTSGRSCQPTSPYAASPTASLCNWASALLAR